MRLHRPGDSIADVICDSQHLDTRCMNTAAAKIQINSCTYGEFFSSLSDLGCIRAKKVAGMNFRQLRASYTGLSNSTTGFCSSNCTRSSFSGMLNVAESTRSVSPFLDWEPDTGRMTFHLLPLEKRALYSLYCYSKAICQPT
jgi:hypothetical protein